MTSRYLVSSIIASIVTPVAPFAHGGVNLAWTHASSSKLHVSVGIGPEEDTSVNGDQHPELVYEIPNHEEFRTSRRTKVDERCDEWFGGLMGSEEDHGILGSLAADARNVLTTPVPLINEVELPTDHEEWTPYVSTKLPWTPLTPAFGLEEFGLPIPRKNAETWRQFDVVGMVAEDYSGSTQDVGKDISLSEAQVTSYQTMLQNAGSWLDNSECQGRLVYINGRFSPQLSKTTDIATNLDSIETASDEVKSCLSRLTDGFTDQLAAPVPVGENLYWDSHKKLSGPDHSTGEPISQFAINTQQGTACFAALNTMRTGSVAYVHVPEGRDEQSSDPLPVLVVNAVSKDGGASSTTDGVALHPRCLVVAEKNSQLEIIQSSVDLDSGERHLPKLYNGYTQVFVKDYSNVTHSLLEESGGTVTSGVERLDRECDADQPLPRDVESKRPAVKDTHLETIDVHVMGNSSTYEGALVSVGGSGRVRIALSVSLLKPGTHTRLDGFSLSGGAQHVDFKTNIHHIAQGTTSEQVQKNLVGGRSTGSFRGRIRVEQSAQQTDSQQISRTLMLSDKARAWAVPSLEIIADDVQCTHGATISDLSEEELFYLRARGLDRTSAKRMLMYAFANEICSRVNSHVVGTRGDKHSLEERLNGRMQMVVPAGDRIVKGEYHSI